MKKSLMMVVGFIVVALGLAFVSTGVDAYRNDPNAKGPNYSQERHEAMTKAFADRDYAAWSELMQGRGRMADKVNEDNFGRFAEAHELLMQGDVEAASEIREELGLGMGMGGREGNGMNRNAHRNCMK